MAVVLLSACGSGEQEPVRSATPSPRPPQSLTVEMKAVETPAPPPAETPPPEVFVEAYHHHEGPPAIVSSEPEAGPAAPAAPAAPPLPDRPIAELLHPPPYTVLVDAGHGSLDSGATNGAVGLLEKDVNLDVATRVAPLLGAAGYNVYLSRWGDYTLSPFPENTYENRRDEIQARVDVANSVHADILVSIHFNGGPKSARGLEIYYNPDRSFGQYNWTLADLTRQGVVNHIRSAGYDVPDRGVKNDAGVCCNPANPHSWILGTNDGFRPSTMPGIIGEAMFVSNDYEAQQLWRPEMRQAIAEGYKSGIDAYFGWLLPQVPPPPPPPPPTPEPTPMPTASPTDTPAPTPSPPTSTPSSTPSPSTSPATGTPTPSAMRLPGPSPGST